MFSVIRNNLCQLHLQGFLHDLLFFLAYEFDKKTLNPLWIKDFIVVQQALNIILQLLISSSYRIILGLVSLFIAIASFILYVGERQRVYLYFSMFALVVVYACIYHSWELFSIFLPWALFTYPYSVIILFGGYFFLRFFAEVFGDGIGNIHKRLWQITLALFIITTIAAIAFPAFYRIYITQYLFEIVSPLILVVVIIASIMTYRHNKDQESFWYMAGFVAFSIFIAYSFLFYEVEAFVQQYAAPFHPFMEAIAYPIQRYYLYMHGVFMLMFCMMMILRERIRTIYYKATKSAADLAALSESLEQLVLERTTELKNSNINLQASMHDQSCCPS